MAAVVHRRPELIPGALRPRRGVTGYRFAAVALLLLVASVIGALPVQLVRVGSDSMTPTLSGGDLVLIGRWHGVPDRSDVVVVAWPSGHGAGLVKRVAGLAGDAVSIDDGVLMVNGTAVCEPWSDPSRLDGVWFGPITVPDGSVFLLGDERDGSVDSRSFGPVVEEDLTGVVLARVWPTPRAVPTSTC